MMKRLCLYVFTGLLFAVQASAADPAPAVTHAPVIHHSACALGESMAGKLGFKKATHEQAQQTCQSLAPTMSAADHAEFVRCCSARLERGAPTEATGGTSP